MMDIEIARKYKKEDIRNIASKVGLKEKDLMLYGSDMAKIVNYRKKKNGKLILVTAISPTPFGEGKTTVSIGLNDALCNLGKNSILALREPSMGPVFGMKGGATGGGYSQIVPMEDINLHFTGDFAAIEAANNLLCAAIDNHIYFGNKLDIKEVIFQRCLDVNDRALRRVKLEDRNEKFNITAASEIMALFCLAEDFNDLKKKLGNIIIGYNSKGEFVKAHELGIEGAMTTLLKTAIKPNLVQTMGGNPAIVHGGPFANIAHGCNSVIATKTALSLGDYVVTEAGFGADLGAEKFLDIKCRKAKLAPDAIVLVATIKALKYHGGVAKDDIFNENVEAMKLGFANLKKHYDNLNKYGVEVIVTLNTYNTDTNNEIKELKNICKENGITLCINDVYNKGGNGAIDLAKEVLKAVKKDNKFKLLYKDNISIEEKASIVTSIIYGASKVNYSDEAKKKLELIKKNKLETYPICIAKTQYSLSDDQKKLGVPKDFEVTVRDINIYNGAGFITLILGNMMTMPGLPKEPNYLKIDVVDDKIIGLN